MPPLSLSRRIAAALSAVIVAGALVVLGGASHGTASGRPFVGHSHAGVSASASHVAPASGKHHISPHQDLSSTPPSVDGTAPAGPADITPAAYTSRVARDLAAPTGRGPPAL